jgi:hypothetical protein
MQSGQNLFEPIGQYPNPYGIQYSDQWVAEYLNDMGIEYLSFEADRTLTREYFQILFNNPGLFLRNFKNRLEFFGSYFSIWSSKRFPINVLTISGCLLTILILSWKHNRFLILGIPLLLAINYLIFFGWVNQLPRLIAPIHFLINIGGTFLMTFALIRLRRCH